MFAAGARAIGALSDCVLAIRPDTISRANSMAPANMNIFLMSFLLSPQSRLMMRISYYIRPITGNPAIGHTG
jgi:hypothetical protein